MEARSGGEGGKKRQINSSNGQKEYIAETPSGGIDLKIHIWLDPLLFILHPYQEKDNSCKSYKKTKNKKGVGDMLMVRNEYEKTITTEKKS